MSRLVGIDDHPASLPTSDLWGEYLVVWGVEWFTMGRRRGAEARTMGDTLYLSWPEEGRGKCEDVLECGGEERKVSMRGILECVRGMWEGGGSVKGRHTIVVGSSDVVCWWGGQTDLSAPSENGTVPCVQFRIRKII